MINTVFYVVYGYELIHQCVKFCSYQIYSFLETKSFLHDHFSLIH